MREGENWELFGDRERELSYLSKQSFSCQTFTHSPNFHCTFQWNSLMWMTRRLAWGTARKEDTAKLVDPRAFGNMGPSDGCKVTGEGHLGHYGFLIKRGPSELGQPHVFAIDGGFEGLAWVDGPRTGARKHRVTPKQPRWFWVLWGLVRQFFCPKAPWSCYGHSPPCSLSRHYQSWVERIHFRMCWTEEIL